MGPELAEDFCAERQRVPAAGAGKPRFPKQKGERKVFHTAFYPQNARIITEELSFWLLNSLMFIAKRDFLTRSKGREGHEPAKKRAMQKGHLNLCKFKIGHQ